MLTLDKKLYDQIIDLCQQVYPNESCGIVAGSNGKATRVIGMANASGDPLHCYLMEPKEQLQVMKQIRNDGLEMLAIYHSHAYSDAYPSARDVELAYYPDAIYIIVSFKDKHNSVLRAFRIINGKISEEALQK